MDIKPFFLFCDNQDTESESYEIEIGVAGPIFTNWNIKGSVGQLYPYSTTLEKNIVGIIHVYSARSIYLLFYDNPDTKSNSCEMEMSIYQPKRHQRLDVTMMYIIYNMGAKYSCTSSCLWIISHYSTIL